MKFRIDKNFPALTFQVIAEEILDDPEYKPSDSDKNYGERMMGNG